MLSRKWWKRIIITAVGTLVFCVLGTIIEWKITRSRGESRREAAVARLAVSEPDWSLPTLTNFRNEGLPPADLNAALVAQQVFDGFSPAYKEWNRTSRELIPTLGIRPRDTDLCELAILLSESEPALTQARSLRRLPRGGFPFTFREPNLVDTDLTLIQNLRQVAQFLTHDAIVQVALGQPDAALGSSLAILNLGRGGVGDLPCLIAQLVRLAITSVSIHTTERVLGLGVASPAMLLELQDQMHQELSAPRLRYALRGERAMFYRILQNFDEGRIDTLDLAVTGMPTGLPARFGFFLSRKHVPAQQAQCLEMMSAYLEAMTLTGRERLAAIEAVPTPVQGFDTLLLNLLLAPIEKFLHSELNLQARLACLTVALACERVRLETGAWPTSLEAIPKRILPECPHDPFTGEPLRYARRPDGVVVYSTGEDQVDQGGTNLEVAGPQKADRDTGVRLLSIEFRGEHPVAAPQPDVPGPGPDGS